MHHWSLFWLLIVLHRDWFESAFISKISFIKYAYNWLKLHLLLLHMYNVHTVLESKPNQSCIVVIYQLFLFVWEKKPCEIILHIDKGTAQFMQSDSVDIHVLCYKTRTFSFISFLRFFNVVEKRVHLIKTKSKEECLFRQFISFTNYLTIKQ